MIEIGFIDHYDSFSLNVIDWISSRYPDVEVLRFFYDDQPRMAEIKRRNLPLILSPGPKSPEQAKSTVEITRSKLGRVPILGVCLGHQILSVIAGGTVGQALRPLHGGLRKVIPTGDGQLFKESSWFEAAAYNSLTVRFDDISMPPGWCVTAKCSDGEIQAIEFEGDTLAVGLQFHPESFLCPKLDWIADSWIKLIRAWKKGERG